MIFTHYTLLIAHYANVEKQTHFHLNLFVRIYLGVFHGPAFLYPIVLFRAIRQRGNSRAVYFYRDRHYFNDAFFLSAPDKINEQLLVINAFDNSLYNQHNAFGFFRQLAGGFNFFCGSFHMFKPFRG